MLLVEMARRVFPWILILFTALLVGCDHGTKLVAQKALEQRGPLRLVRGVLDLRYTENHDTAFSLTRALDFQGKPAVLGALALFALAAVAVFWWRRRHASRLEQAGYGLIVAGAIGNVLDRITRGYVIDFIHVHHWPVFNVADILVALGVGALALAAARGGGRPEPEPPPA
jgi:signal peptidase II